MKTEQFFAACKRLIKRGWQAKLGQRNHGRQILLKRPGGRTFCFDPITAVYSDYCGEVCYNESQSQRGLGGLDPLLWSAAHGCAAWEGSEETCAKLYEKIK